MREKLLSYLDRQEGVTIQTLCQLAKEPIVQINHELDEMGRDSLVYHKSGQIFLTAHGDQEKSKLSTVGRR